MGIELHGVGKTAPCGEANSRWRTGSCFRINLWLFGLRLIVVLSIHLSPQYYMAVKGGHEWCAVDVFRPSNRTEDFLQCIPGNVNSNPHEREYDLRSLTPSVERGT